MANGHGEKCTYCEREMRTDVEKHHPLFATRDHMIPKSKINGNQNTRVWACFQCNQIKADRFPEQWERFMKRNPRWWEHPAVNDGFQALPKLPRSEPPKSKPPPWQETCRFLREANERALEKIAQASTLTNGDG